VGYCRVSTAKQVHGGISLEQQAAAIPSYCQQHGLQLLQVHQDAGISGKRAANRPGLQAALEQVQRVCGTLVVPSVSRLGRSVRDVALLTQQLTDAGVRVVFVKESVDTSTAHGRFLLHLLGALAELELEQLRERVQDGIQHARSKGLKLGGQPPYGWSAVQAGQKRDGRPVWKLKRHPAEQGVVRRIMDMRAAGAGYHVIAQTLADDGVRGRTGRPLNIKVVWSIVQRQQQTQGVTA
jgi:DNA invertase Pin-like site-specific DNA recombinase